MRTALALTLALAMALAVVASGCKLDSTCLDCVTGDDDIDGGDRDGGVDGGDGGAPPDACIPTGFDEECNGLDDDCDGDTDEDALTVGDACGTDVGECSAGVVTCAGGELGCTGAPATPEACDNLDNDCDSAVDEGNPEGGEECGSDVGECIAGITTCDNGTVDCIGDVGTPGAVAETCDGRDNDCDGMFDEGLPPLGSCGTDTGLCTPGTLMCVGGGTQCVGGNGPVLELCDSLDQDCDGNNTNGFNLQIDIANCGTCGHSCVGELANANEKCEAGMCAIASCESDFHDNNGNAADGCEYGPCVFAGPVEACNNVDDDCDGDIDENLSAPPICNQTGACAGTTAVCTPTGFDCVYTGDVSVDGMGNLIPETECDNVDNDCDGRVDESHPLKGTACNDGANGVCRAFGDYVCDASDEDGPVECVIDTPGQPSTAEVCDNLDNNCDGTVDNGATTGALQDWVTIGGSTKQIMKYEASKPDATASLVGSVTAYACSRAGVQPWTNVTQPQAEAACQSIGARLCTEQEWHMACSVRTPTTFPLTEPAASNGYMFIEAEDHVLNTPRTSGGTLRAWVPDYTPGFSGLSALRASPNTGANLAAAVADAEGPRLDFTINFTQTGNHYVWVRAYSPTSSDDRAWIGISTAPGTTDPTQSITTATNNAWEWERTAAINVTATGVRTVSIYMREDGLRVDAIVITRSNSTTDPTETSGNGGDWAFQNNPDTFVATTCNGDPFDTDTGTAGDQDDVLPTGTMTGGQCFANGPTTNDAFDMTGNVKEWTAERTPGANPARGGASNNEREGLTCANAFTLANDSFFFPNIGFRCCR